MTPKIERRGFLAAAASASTLLAGCSGSSPVGNGDAETPTATEDSKFILGATELEVMYDRVGASFTVYNSGFAGDTAYAHVKIHAADRQWFEGYRECPLGGGDQRWFGLYWDCDPGVATTINRCSVELVSEAEASENVDSQESR